LHVPRVGVRCGYIGPRKVEATSTTIAAKNNCGSSLNMDMSEGSPATVPCEEKERLLVAKSKAFDLYTRRASELAEAATTIAHAEFEFVANRVSAAKQFWIETRKQLNEHTAKHGC
jgi:hypothetical protein